MKNMLSVIYPLQRYILFLKTQLLIHHSITSTSLCKLRSKITQDITMIWLQNNNILVFGPDIVKSKTHKQTSRSGPKNSRYCPSWGRSRGKRGSPSLQTGSSPENLDFRSFFVKKKNIVLCLSIFMKYNTNVSDFQGLTVMFTSWLISRNPSL